jgi:hypothetical protein
MARSLIGRGPQKSSIFRTGGTDAEYLKIEQFLVYQGMHFRQRDN